MMSIIKPLMIEFVKRYDDIEEIIFFIYNL